MITLLCCPMRWWSWSLVKIPHIFWLGRNPTVFLSHIISHSHDDRFPIPLWETWFSSSLGVPIPALIANPQQCPCRQFCFDPYGDHIQTCHRKYEQYPSTNGSCIISVCCFDRLVTGWKPPKLLPCLEIYEEILRSRSMWSCHGVKRTRFLHEHRSWMSRWPMIDMDVLDTEHTNDCLWHRQEHDLQLRTHMVCVCVCVCVKLDHRWHFIRRERIELWRQMFVQQTFVSTGHGRFEIFDFSNRWDLTRTGRG